jgi:dnd system-associated protein 4
MRRIQRDASHEEFIQSLISADPPIFRDIWRILLFSAAYGVKHGQRKPLTKVESNKSFPDSYFNTPGWKGFLYLLGFADSESCEHLRNAEEEQNELLTAFEEYANYGLIDIKERLESSSDKLATFVEIIEESTKETSPMAPDLSGMDQL